MNQDWIQFWTLLEPEHPRAQAFCRKLAGDFDEGDDLYQEALVRALPAFEGLRDQAAFVPWLYRIIINQYKTRCQRSWWRRFVPLTGHARVLADDADPSSRLATRQRLEIALGVLSAEDRALVVLKELEGWTIADLADLTGRSAGSLKTRLSRARAAMREALIARAKRRGAASQSQALQLEDGICVVTKPDSR